MRNFDEKSRLLIRDNTEAKDIESARGPWPQVSKYMALF